MQPSKYIRYSYFFLFRNWIKCKINWNQSMRKCRVYFSLFPFFKEIFIGYYKIYSLLFLFLLSRIKKLYWINKNCNFDIEFDTVFVFHTVTVCFDICVCARARTCVCVPSNFRYFGGKMNRGRSVPRISIAVYRYYRSVEANERDPPETTRLRRPHWPQMPLESVFRENRRNRTI